MKTKLAAMFAGSSLLALGSPALAQQTQSPPNQQNQQAQSAETEDGQDDEIVVTGTFIRGIAPTGNQVLGVTSDDVLASGGMTVTDVLAGVPQVASMFNTLNAIGLSGATGTGTMANNTTVQVQRPQLRNLGGGTFGATPTLVLMDGHRMVGVGVNSATPDPAVLPPGMLERVEIVTDGGSALYGTDAVGGVLNFITRRSFDGVQLSGRYAFGEDVRNYDASIAAGTDWGSGSVFAAISHHEDDPIFGIDRDWMSGVNWNPAAPFSRYLTGELRQCTTPNVTVGSTNFAVANPTTIGAANSYNACDITDYQTIIPETEATNYFAGFSQELADNVDLDVRAFYTERSSLNGRGPQLGTVRVDDEVASTGTPGRSPYYVDVPGALADGAIESVLFNYAPFNGNGLGASAFNNTEVWTWGVTPTLTIALPGEWQLTTLANYGKSEAFFLNHEINGDRQQYYATGGVAPPGAACVFNTIANATGCNFNPYNIGASNPTVLADITNWQRYGWASQAMTNFRAVIDGPLLTLPGGDVRGAFGAEYIKEEIERRTGFTNLHAESTLSTVSIDRDVTAFFGELNIPIVGEGNRLPLVESFTLSLSARHDDYSDFGETTNPQVGIVWELTDWFAVRGNWGTSFQAPSAVEVLDKNFPTVQVNNTVFNWGNLAVSPDHRTINDGPPAPTTNLEVCTGGTHPNVGQQVCTAATNSATFRTLVLFGADPNLQPQTGESWSLGFDAHAPFLPSLRLSATYYNIHFENTLSNFAVAASFQPSQTGYNFWNGYLWINGTDGTGPSGAFTAGDITTFCAASLNPTDCNGIAADPTSLYFIADGRSGNFGGTLQEGVDVSVRYSHDFDWGSWDAAVSGNYRINAETDPPGPVTWTKTNLDGLSRYSVSANTAVTLGDFYGRVTVNYSEGFKFYTPLNASNFNQTEVDAFYPVDLFLRYDLGELGLADNLQLTLNVDNVFDIDPPELRTTGTTGYTNGATLGRVFTVGFTADF